MGSDRFVSTSFSQLIEEGILEIGDGYRAKNEELGGSGPIFLRAGHVTDTTIDFDGVERFHAHLEPKLRAKFSSPGDTIITTKGNSTGRTSFVTSRMPTFVYSPHLSYWRTRDPERLAGGFLRYWSKSKEFSLQLSAMKGSTDMAPYLSLTDQRRLKITLPPADVQRSVASILGALDDKIELNRRRNQTLEAMARAIFKSWFVDFDPVKAKAAVRRDHPDWTNEQVSRTACPGVNLEVSSLFPDSFEESALGPIPAGWQACPVPAVCEVNPPRSLSKGALAPYLDMSAIPTQGPIPDSWVNREVGSGMKFMNGDTLIARITPCLENGKSAFVNFLADGEVAWGSTEFIVLRPHGSIPLEFAYLLARDEGFRTFLIQQMTGSSGRQRVPSESLSKFLLAVPAVDNSLFERLGALVSPMFDRMKAGAHESRGLGNIRDALLPKLISGELRIPDTERIVGRSV